MMEKYSQPIFIDNKQHVDHRNYMFKDALGGFHYELNSFHSRKKARKGQCVKLCKYNCCDTVWAAVPAVLHPSVLTLNFLVPVVTIVNSKNKIL